MPFVLYCTISPKGIKPPYKIHIGNFETISDINTAARGFIAGMMVSSSGIGKHNISPRYYSGYKKGLLYKGAAYNLIYENLV